MVKPLLEARGVCKAFGDVVALDHVNFSVNKGEIHGLLGENGAGKTTLMNIIYGLYKADEGEILIDGKKETISSPKDAIKKKIGMVHQHFTLVPEYTVLENIILGMKREGKFSPTLCSKEEKEKILKLSEKFGLKFPLDVKIKGLPMGVRQRVEIARVLYRGAEILILDEPTSSLVPHEVDTLFDSLRIMVKKGLTIIFITHKIREAMSVCDRVTVLRDGKVRCIFDRKEMSPSKLVTMMVGERIDVKKSILYGRLRRGITLARPSRKPVLTVRNLFVPGGKGTLAVKKCSFEVYGGEIFGMAGVSGNGQKELLDAILKLRKAEKGDIIIDGKNVKDLSTCEILDLGTVYIPEDRIAEGVLPSVTVAENLILGYQKQFCKKKFSLSWLDLKSIRETSKKLICDYEIKTPGEKALAQTLSGGNIQRMMLARAFSHPAKLLIAHDPTKGLDVAFTEFVLKKLVESKNKGTAVLWICEDLDQLLLVSDRIGVIYEGEIVGVLKRKEFDKYKIGMAMTGVKRI
jgi:simple sugar transport system ATP-binding protein